MDNISKKIAIGTAQFGLDYGINNMKGRMSDEELNDVLNICSESGIECIDTAYSYGDSEERIGKYTKKNNFRIISKLPGCSAMEVENKVCESLARLNIESVYGYLVHNAETLKKNPEVFSELRRIKDKGLINKIGFSLYSTDELETLFNDEIDFDIIQVPYNIFDRRFESYFQILKEKNIEVHTRSVYLQGLFFIKPDKLNAWFAPVKDKIIYLNEISKKSGIGIHHLCFSFVNKNTFVDKIVIGVDGKEHLLNLLHAGNELDKALIYYNELKNLREDNPDIILPYKWK